jgi:glycosyltransferase involved in cell wall biosynthesis
LINPKSEAVRLIEHFVPDEALPDLFSSCHCFLLPYTNFSSDSGVAYMALANAKPIISTGAGGLGWLLEQSKGGLTISEANLEGIVAALRIAVELGPQGLERLGQAGGRWVLENCGWPKVARETRELYAEWIDELKSKAHFGEMQQANESALETTR